MNREFLINAIFLVLVNLLIKPFYVFGIERVIQDRVGAETYGLYATLFSFTFLLFMVNDFGIHYYNNRTISQYPQLVRKYFPNILILKLGLSALFILLVFGAALIRGFDVEIFGLIFFITLNHVLISLVAYLRSNISGLGMYRVDSVVSTLDKLFLIVFCAILLWSNPFTDGGPFQIIWFVHSQNIAWFLTATIAFIIVFRKVKQGLIWRVNFPFILLVLKKSFPFALAVFLMTAYTRFDIVILEWMLPDGFYHAGVYAASYRLLDAFNMVGYLFAGLLMPMFSKLLKEKSLEAKSEMTGLLRLSLQLIWAGTISLAVASFFFQLEIMELLYPQSVTPENVEYYGEVMGFLILTLVPFSGVFVYSTLLTANDSLRKMNRLFIIGIVVNIGLNLLLIPLMQATGAAMAALVTQTVVLFAMKMLAKKELTLSSEPRMAFRILAFSLLTIITAYIFYHFVGMNWMLKFGSSILFSLAFAFIFKLINLNSLFAMAKK